MIRVRAMLVAGFSCLVLAACESSTHRADGIRLPGADRPLAVFIGDSYTAGSGASTPAHNFAALVSATLGWDMVNLGRGGTGYLRSVGGDLAPLACGLEHCRSYVEMIPEAAAFAPDVVVVSGGRNEIDSGFDAARAGAIAGFYVQLREALPGATLFATSPIWDDDPAPTGIQRQREAVRQAVEAVGGVYLDLGDPLAGHPSMVGNDSVHPTDAGHAAIADAFVAALRGR